MEGEVRGRPSLRFPPPSRVAALFPIVPSRQPCAPVGPCVLVGTAARAQPFVLHALHVKRKVLLRPTGSALRRDE